MPAPVALPPADILIREHNFRRPAAALPNERGYSYSAEPNGIIHVSWSEMFDFIVSADGREIDVYTEPEPASELVYTHLITQVISIALLQKGIESFHASAVELDGKGIVLIGESGYGKSTLTAALLLSGSRLITDDLLVLQKDDGRFGAVPGAARIKLSPTTAVALGLAWPHSPMIDGSGKHVYMVPPGSMVSEPLAIDRILLLRPDAPAVNINTVIAARATPQLLAAVFNPLHTSAARLEMLLALCRDIALSVECAELHVPRDLQRLPQVIAAIRQ